MSAVEFERFSPQSLGGDLEATLDECQSRLVSLTTLKDAAAVSRSNSERLTRKAELAEDQAASLASEIATLALGASESILRESDNQLLNPWLTAFWSLYYHALAENPLEPVPDEVRVQIGQRLDIIDRALSKDSLMAWMPVGANEIIVGKTKEPGLHFKTDSSGINPTIRTGEFDGVVVRPYHGYGKEPVQIDDFTGSIPILGVEAAKEYRPIGSPDFGPKQVERLTAMQTGLYDNIMLGDEAVEARLKDLRGARSTNLADFYDNFNDAFIEVTKKST